MNKLQELMESNADLKAKLETLNQDPQATVADFIALAKEYGVEFTEADFRPVSTEVSDDELETVAGGDKCYCVAGGGGTNDDWHDTCACVLGGIGFKKPGRGASSQCVCMVTGDGYGE